MENKYVENETEVLETAEAPVSQTDSVVTEETAPVVEVAGETNSQGEKLKASFDAATQKGKAFVETTVAKVKANPKEMGIKIGAVVLAVVVLVTLLFVGIGAITNNCKTPVKIMQKYANERKYYESTDMTVELLNGFGEKEVKAFVKLYEDSEDYEDNLEDAKDRFEESIEDKKDEYGKNYKYTYKIIDKEKLDKDELKEFRDNLRNRADNYEEQIEETEDFDSDDWEEFADVLGFDGNKSKAKTLVSALKNLRKLYKNAKVTAGYKLTVEIVITGSELDEPDKTEMELNVYKVNGRWTTSRSVFF